jgi:hypothetical protein
VGRPISDRGIVFLRVSGFHLRAHLRYKGQSVNRSQMDIKCNVQSLYQWVETRSIEDCCLRHFRTSSGNICDFRMSLKEFIDPVVNRFTWQTLPNLNKKYFFMNILRIETLGPHKKTHNRTLLFGSILLKHGRHSDYSNQLWTCACASVT